MSWRGSHAKVHPNGTYLGCWGSAAASLAAEVGSPAIAMLQVGSSTIGDCVSGVGVVDARARYDNDAMSQAARIRITIGASVLVFVGLVVFVFPSGCNDGGGVSSWERCTTPIGTPAFSVEDWGWDSTLNVVPPVVAAALVGFLVWVLLRRSEANSRSS